MGIKLGDIECTPVEYCTAILLELTESLWPNLIQVTLKEVHAGCFLNVRQGRAVCARGLTRGRSEETSSELAEAAANKYS